LLRQGKVNRGIFGMGEIAGAPSLADYRGTSQMMVPVRFIRLVDPEKRTPLIRHDILSTVLDASQIDTQSSGITVSFHQSLALEAMIPDFDRMIEGSDWSGAEVAALVADYFAMLHEEVNTRAYSKSEHRRALMRQVKRSEGSIERKHQNVSAVLHKLGFRWIDGYKPLGNIQAILVPEVEKHLRSSGRELDSAPQSKAPGVQPLSEVFVDPPVGLDKAKVIAELAPVARKFDVAKRDARNRALGRSGEEFVVALEKRRLTELGLIEKADDVVWVSDLQGDGLGYDIRSFDKNAEELFIEVKTTRGDIDAPFFLTERERTVALRKGRSYELYRVFAFGREPKVFVVPGPLEDRLHLKPTAYRVKVRAAPQLQASELVITKS
jgi:hypothetical protein